MSLANTDELCTIDHLRLALGHPDDDQDDADKLQDVCRAASLETMAMIRPYLSGDTKLAGTVFHETAVYTSLKLAQAQWYEHNFNLEQAEHFRRLYTESVKALIKALRTERNERDQAVYVDSGARSPLDRTYTPSERDQYVIREFI